MRLFLIFWLLGCLFVEAPEHISVRSFRIMGFAQGTSYQITYYAKEQHVNKPEIQQILNSIDSSLSIYKSYSLISQFNRSATGLTIDQHLKKVVEKSIEISNQTGGAFEITIQPLVQAWGLGTEPIAAIPDSAQVQSLLKCVGTEKVQLKKDYLKKKSPCVRLDVNGIAQGYTVDVLAEYLEAKGINHYLVELGGEIRIKGRKQPGGELMAIGIEAPTEDGEQAFPIQTIIRPAYGAVTTSGDYRKYLETGSGKLSHLINPKSGFPFQNEMISATVWAKDAITADGYDNAMMGMGMEKALEFAEKKENLEAYFIYRQASGSVADTATTGFYKLMK
ncbi:ApbE family lipoprotein [Flammeovirgaceae bacterium 311]|nr:ApbE family lipoprotein [Flammeovirgaceae bacterium 311]